LRNYFRTRARRYEPFIFFGGGPLSPGIFRTILTKGHCYDLIHLNCLVYSHVAYGYWAARRIGAPVVITPHLHAEQETTYNIGYQRQAMAGADYLLAVTSSERGLLLRLGLDPLRVGISGNGLRPEQVQDASTWDKETARRRLGLPQDAFVLLFLGRKSDYKGLDLALDAYAALRVLYPQMRFLAVGPETEYSQSLWLQHQGLPGLQVLGTVTDDIKLAALRACDCLVLPSMGEAFGIVFLEAWILERPVIGLRTPAMEAVISDGRDGLLANPADVADLAVCIARLATCPSLAQRMGAAGREKVLRRYTVSLITDRVEGAYGRLLRQARRERGSCDPRSASRGSPLRYAPGSVSASSARDRTQ
jgi:D-inositol-3-phosphate glycosyltransferase